ncbi:MAG: hypothetical protein IJ415_04760, partial [Clostridia bacterium]|nr:hypothetical protein [Clostridia bacterium]
MKKIYCFALILLSLFSCVVFSACGNKFKDLEMEFYSSTGEVIGEANFIIDKSKTTSSQRIGIEFSGIDKQDIGQVKVYSLPNELIMDTNYVYTNNMCYVDITPVMPSSDGAKLVVFHLASGKKAEIDLNIEQKSQDLQIINSKYIISIPDEGDTTHTVSYSNLINLIPVGSTDKVYFKILENNAGVEPIPAEGEGLTDLFTGFKVNSAQTESTDSTCVKIYPVAYMEGYPNDEYTHKVISIYFRKTLNDENFAITPEDDVDVDLDNLQLLANDDVTNSFKLNLKYGEKSLIETNFFDMYQVEAISTDDQKISALLDSNNDVIVMAKTYTDSLVEVKIVLKPINYVGDIKRVEKSIFVKGELKADSIEVKKNGEEISTSENTNIFDYYEEGNSLGASFTFTPFAKNGIAVNYNLNKMKIVVSPDILCKENCPEVSESEVVNPEIADGVKVNDKLYSLMFHLFNDYLKFYYDENSKMMVSEEIDQNDRIYIKYVDGNANGVESTKFEMKVKTIFDEDNAPENWKNLTSTEIELKFNRLEGVKSMSLEAGYYEVVVDNGESKGKYNNFGENPEYIYLNRLEGLDNADATIKYVSVINNSVKSVDDAPISKVEFEVEITALSNVNNPLTIYNGLPAREVQSGVSKLSYEYDSSKDADVVGLVFRNDGATKTDIGDYKITFYQEGIVKVSVICRVYEDLNGVSLDDISIDNKAKANTEYADVYAADYIVASGQDLNISIDLNDAVLNSDILAGYSFTYEVGVLENETLVAVEDKTEFFNIAHDDSSLNNAVLKFLKGTYVDKPQYVYLTITVKTKIFENLITISDMVDDTTNKVTISFFIYDEIKNEDISINHTSMTCYFEEYLGVYYKENSQADLQIEMADDLWKYVTKSSSGNLVDWQIDETLGVTVTENEKTYHVQFNYVLGQSNYVRIVKAYIYQFDKIFEFRCVFNVQKPIISERVIIQSEVEIRDNENQTYYINLKQGETYKLNATNYSSKGNVSFAETIIQVSDENGSAFTARNYFDIDQANGTIKVKKVDGTHNFKLVVFAKDALQYIPSSDKSGYNNPSSFIMDFETGEDSGKYLNAYFVMDIELSNGTEDNPYLIKNANEFWEIDDTEEFKSAYYKLMTSISLDNTTDTNIKTISGFIGKIITDNNNVYTIDGITLDSTNKNLFSGFAGEIYNIKFVVDYDYDLSTNSNENLGLFDINNGKLFDVSVTVGGKAKLNKINTSAKNEIYFGGLVGLNNGTIKYNEIFGVNGSISLEGNATT